MPSVLSIPAAIAALKFEPAEEFSPSRFPYTYAADYLRDHPTVVPGPVFDDPDLWSAQHTHLWSRATAALIRQRWAELTNISDETAAVLLAEAYLREHRIVPPAEVYEQIQAATKEGQR